MAEAAPHTLPWHRRLEARVVTGVGLLVACSLGAVLIVTTRAVTDSSLTRASDELQAARAAFYRLVDDRAEFASTEAALVTALPVFRAHMTDTRIAEDAATLGAMADEYRRQLKSDFCVVTDRDGRWTAQSGWSSTLEPPAPVRTLIAKAKGGQPARGIVALGDRLFLVVSEPARFAEEILGTLTVGYPLDDAVAKQLAAETHCEINLLSGSQVYASSLAQADRGALASLVKSLPAGTPPAEPVRGVQRIGAANYAVGTFPLSSARPGPESGRLVLMQSWLPTELFISQVQGRLLAAGMLVLALALFGSFVFSHRMSAPLQDLARASEDIAGGNWSRQVVARGSAEATMMARAFNSMTTSLRHWYEEAKKRDDELRQAQKMDAIGRLAGGVAHDFNNLLTAIKGYAELLLNQIDVNDPRHEDADEIVKAADRAAGLTKQLLAFSRRQVVVPRVIALDAVITGTSQMLRRLIGEDIALNTVIAPSLGLVRADPSQIEQVVLNLAVNARDAMPNGGTLRLELSNVVLHEGSIGHWPPQLAHGAYVRLSVADAGVGMGPETVARIFEPFFTTKEEGRGTGLGLAMVYGIVEQAGGAIDVDSEVGRGTTFHVYLPHTSERADAPAPAPRVGTVRGNETVLLVEDEPRVAVLIANSLKKAGYTVLQAMHGERALEIVRAHAGPIDLLLTDVVMPGMNGRELAEQVKLARQGIPVLYMSGYSDDAILRSGIQTASAQFIQKPFSMDALMGKMREAIRQTAPRP